MPLTHLHVLLTYQCVFECGHCFIWGSKHGSIFHPERLDAVLDQAVELRTVREVCFEGGETFVYYPILIAAVRHAAARRLRTAVVTNGYWANSAEQARLWLGRLVDAGLERIYFVANERRPVAHDLATHPGVLAAQQMGLVTSVLGSGAGAAGIRPSEVNGSPRLPGRPAPTQPSDEKTSYPWQTFTACPYTDLRSPRHLHVDPSGDLHLCPGLVIGNVFECPLSSVVASYSPESHPIAGPLVSGGPAALVARYGLEQDTSYQDACALCRHSQTMLRSRFASRAGYDAVPSAEAKPTGEEPVRFPS